MKKRLSVLLALAMAIGLLACADTQESSPQTVEISDPTSPVSLFRRGQR